MTFRRHSVYLLETRVIISDPLEDKVRYFSPATAREALELMAEFGSRARPLAGGTDLVVLARSKGWPDAVISLRYLGWDDVEAEAGHLRIGATTTASSIAVKLREAIPLLATSASWLGGPQVRNRATIGGNLANASPAADMGLCLLLLDAHVELVSLRGSRRIPVADFLLGPRATALGDGELLRAVLVPLPSAGERTRFYKVGPRSRHFISRVAVAGLFRDAEGPAEVRIGLGAVAPTPIRARRAEEYAAGVARWGPREVAAAARIAAEECAPIDDVRASASYRKDMVRSFVARFLREVIP
jgi:CO/xanthine dehydrogenase FAD-binding subunit